MAATGPSWHTVGKTTFDAFGRQLTTTDIRNNTTTTEYTPATGIATAKTVTNHLGWVTTTQLSPYWGTPVKTTDPNGRIAEASYDALGRASEVWNVGWRRADHPTTPSARFSYSYSPTRSAYPWIKTETLNVAGNYVTSYEIFDAFLRPRQTQGPGAGGGRVVADTLYDAWGRVAMTYAAHVEQGAANGTLWWEPEWSVPSQNRTVFDRAGRATDEIFLAGDGVTNIVEKWRTSTVHAGDQTTVTPPAGGTKTTTVTDALGRTAELWQYTSPTAYDITRYSQDRRDQLTKVVDSAGNEWTNTYDVKGRLVQAKDPDKGTTTSEYNDANDLVKTTDARGEVLITTYDSLGRTTATYGGTESAATKRTEFIYDKLYVGNTLRGQLTQTIRYEGGNAYKWQARGFTDRYQVTGANYVIPASESGLAGTYVVGNGYSASTGDPTSITYPAGGGLVTEYVSTGYDATSGLPTTLSSNTPNVGAYVAGQQYTSYGEPTVTTMKIAGGVYTEQGISYDTATRRIMSTVVKPETSTGTVSDRAYGYDNAGNVLSISDSPQVGQADRQCFGYDSLRRLTSAWTPKSGVTCSSTPTVANLGGPAPYWKDWTIDKVGNRTREVSHTAAGDITRTYAVPASGATAVRPHAVTGMSTTAPGQPTVITQYGYDATGNMTARPGATAGQIMTWDVEGRLVKTVEGATTTTNLYDAHGTRLISRDGPNATLYLPGMEIRRVGAGTSATYTGTRYYAFGGKTVASRQPNQKLNWLFADHQGTQQISVDAYTQQVTTRRQTPYGEIRGAAPMWPTTKGFVGGDNDTTGLTHLGAREYDPGLGRFISVDPIQNLTDPQQWNAYSYANNSPVTLSDPDGLEPRPWHNPNYTPDLCNNNSSKECNPGDYEGGVGKKKGKPTAGTKLKNRGGSKSRFFKTLGKDLLDSVNMAVNPSSCVAKGVEGCKEQALIGLRTLQFAGTVGQCGLGSCDSLKSSLDCQDGFTAECNAHLTAFAIEIVLARKLGPKGKVGCSFTPATEVLMADGTTRPIGDLEPGDVVMAYDPQAGDNVGKPITLVHENLDIDLADLTVLGEDAEEKVIHTTQNHPFWDDTTREWTRVDQLRVGHKLRSGTGSALRVVAVRAFAQQSHMIDLTVADLHTYYVIAGTTPVLVHNCGGSSAITHARLGHIEYRHGPGAQDMARNAGERNIPGEFSEDFLWKGDDMVLGDRLRRGADSSPELPNPNGPGHLHQFDYGSPVGVNGAGQSTNMVEVVVRDGKIWTAYPK